jgi:very-short-patch-repair endonuclease
MDVTAATNRAAAWQQALCDMGSLIGEVFGNAIREREFGFLRDLIRRLQAFPEPPRPGWFDDRKEAADRTFRRAVLGFAVHIQRAGEIADELAAAFEPRTAGELELDELDAIREGANALGIANSTPEAVARELSAVRKRARDWEVVRSGIQRLLGLFGLEDRSGTSVSHALSAAQFVLDADRTLLLARTEALVDESHGQILKAAAKRYQQLRAQRDDLVKRYHLASVPAADKLRTYAASLRQGGFLAALDRDRKEARRTFRAISRSEVKIKPADMAVEFDWLAEHLEKEAELQKDESLRAVLGPGPIEAETDLSLPLSVNAWAGEIVQAFPGLNPVRRHIRNVLLKGDVAVLDEIRSIYEGLTHLAPSLVVAKEALSCDDIQSRLSAETGRAHRLGEILERIAALSFRADRPLGDFAALKKLVVERDHIAHEIDNCDEARRWFGEAFAGLTSVLSSFADELSYLARLEEIGLSDEVCHAIFELACERPGSVDALKWDLKATLERVEETWRTLCGIAGIDEATFFAPSRMQTLSLGVLVDRAARCGAGGQALSTWHGLQLARSAALETPGRIVVEILERAGLPLTDLVRAFDFVLYRGLASVVYQDHADLQLISGHQLRDSRKALAQLDENLLDLERRRIAYELFRRQVDPGIGMGRPGDYTERALIQHSVSLQRSPLAIRDLLRRAGTAARQLKPCFMMSPVTVAQFLPQAPELFDLVIIDEASQMRPEDAFGGIARAKQCVIVGDPMQLPPTSFFETAFWTQTDGDDADDQLYQQVESILDLALRAFRPTRYLRWHYRSLHSGLIQFSNHHFYNEKLIVFPAANEEDPELGVHFEPVHGYYEGRRNVDEARAVVDAVLEFTKSPRTRNLSLGVVAINQTQRDFLSELLDQAFAKDPRADSYRRKWDGTLYPFFIKNLENVQGDERDAIFISMVYGPDRQSGRVANRFGPINRPGGQRRLNVLFTRARRQVRVFSSMNASDVLVSDRSSAGVEILRAYLEYAATGRLHSGHHGVGGATDSAFEDFVKCRLEANGFEAVPQVGVAGYRIDLGVRHPVHPHGFLLGIECDGATYHSAKSVRDRDRLRQMILEGLGWEIYRIWSTDWFASPEDEFEKLLAHLRSKIARPHGMEPDSAATSTQAPGSALPGFVVESVPPPAEEGRVAILDDAYQPQDQEVASPNGASAEEALEVAEIGDVVEYARAEEDGPVRRVRIVRGPDDPDQGIINDAKPLAIALLGCSVGERTTVEQPTSTVDVVVLRIIKQPEDRDPTPPARHGPTSDAMARAAESEITKLVPYSAWSGRHVPDPRVADQGIVGKALYEIIEIEGPVLVARAYRLYSRACGLQRVGRQVQASLNRALSRLIRSNQVVVENERNEPGLIHDIARLSGTERVRLRERGPRTFEEIPLSELAEHLRSIREELFDVTEEELGRELLERYGLVRMTRQVRNTLSQACNDQPS